MTPLPLVCPFSSCMPLIPMCAPFPHVYPLSSCVPPFPCVHVPTINRHYDAQSGLMYCRSSDRRFCCLCHCLQGPSRLVDAWLPSSNHVCLSNHMSEYDPIATYLVRINRPHFAPPSDHGSQRSGDLYHQVDRENDDGHDDFESE